MKSNATNPIDYVNELPADRQEIISKIRKTIIENLPEGFVETMSYGMLGYVIPHSIYPKGYHCDPKLPLPFINLASQKNFIAFYHMGLYANSDLQNWFINEYQKTGLRLDMGKSCVRFKNPDKIPYSLLADLCKKITVTKWIECMEEMANR